MRKILAIATALLVSTPALADGWGHRHGQGFAGVPPRHYHGGGGDAGAALFGGLVGGLIIGGMINNMNQPRYYYNQPVYQDYYEPACRQVIVNRYWNGWQWVSRVATVCD